MDEEIVGAIDRAGNHDIGAAIVQAVACQLDGVERRGAGRIERKGIAAQIQRLCGEMSRQPGREAVARVGRGYAGRARHARFLCGEPGGLGKLHQARARIGEIAHDQAGAGGGIR